MSKSFFRYAACALAALALPLVSAADSLVVLGKFNGISYEFELEVALDLSAISVSVDSTALGNLNLEFDAGENQWDVESAALSLSELNDILSDPFNLNITTGSGQSIYSVAALGALGAGDFPERATSLVISYPTSNLRPTASWTGGDPSADLSFLTYFKIPEGDEFGGQITPAADASSTLGEDLAPGPYTATLAYWAIISGVDLDLLTGDDIFAPEPGISGFAAVGETNVDTTVVPLPAAAWLFGAALLGLGGLLRRRVRG